MTLHKKNTKPKAVNCPTKANSIKFRAQRWQSSRSRRRSPFLLVGRGGRRSLSVDIPADKELAALQRFNQLERFKALVAGGVNQSNAARHCGMGRTSAWRWLKRFESGGLAALVPQTDRRGRRSAADLSGLTPSLVKLLRAICAGVGNVPRGFRLFASTEVCPPHLARFIRRSKSIPQSLRQLVAVQPVHFTGLQAGNQIVLIQQGGAR